jgi:hypothetical protein
MELARRGHAIGCTVALRSSYHARFMLKSTYRRRLVGELRSKAGTRGRERDCSKCLSKSTANEDVSGFPLAGLSGGRARLRPSIRILSAIN